jgi:CRISPR-associated protein Cmr6
MRATLQPLGTPEHVGLAYDAWAPLGHDGTVPVACRASWLSDLAAMAVPPDYATAFARWRASFAAPGDRVFELVLASRLLVGHGNASATDVGLTVHHTWGVPLIPGSALKGLLAHYVDAVYGPDDPTPPPWDQPGPEAERADYQGVTWRGRRVQRGPGAVYRALFGAPDAEEDATMLEHGYEAGAVASLVVFHDALYVPYGLAAERPFTTDVLTVHQKGYYDSEGASWPNDHDSPNPVAFLTVSPGRRMLFALSGPADWTELAERLLRDALAKWGVGGKTTAGYGRFVAPDVQAKRMGGIGTAAQAGSGVRPKTDNVVEAVLLEERTRKGGWKARHEPSGLVGHIHNSGEVPAGAQPGDRLSLLVAYVTDREIAFRFPGLQRNLWVLEGLTVGPDAPVANHPSERRFQGGVRLGLH